MHISINHIGVRALPVRSVQLTGRADDRPFTLDFDDDLIQQVCGNARDEQSMRLALTRNQEALRVAITAYVSARGVPLDSHFLLSWRDFSEANRGLLAPGT